MNDPHASVISSISSDLVYLCLVLYRKTNSIAFVNPTQRKKAHEWCRNLLIPEGWTWHLESIQWLIFEINQPLKNRPTSCVILWSLENTSGRLLTMIKKKNLNFSFNLSNLTIFYTQKNRISQQKMGETLSCRDLNEKTDSTLILQLCSVRSCRQELICLA